MYIKNLIIIYSYIAISMWNSIPPKLTIYY